jgi:hypothetical protein
MKQITLLIFVLLIVLLPVALAKEKFIDFDESAFAGLSEQEKTDLQKQMLVNQLDKIKEDFNANPEVPSSLKMFLGSLKANIYMDGGYTIGFVMTGARIETLQSGEISDPDLNMYVKDAVFSDMQKNTYNFKASLGKGDIDVTGVGFLNKIKFGALKMILRTLG